MSRTYEEAEAQLQRDPKRWLVTGVAGFIGSNLLQKLLGLDQVVVGLDNFSTGKRENLTDVKSVVTEKQWSRFRFVEGDIRALEDCQLVCSEIDVVLNEAALGSVPRSLEDPLLTNENNITGTLNMLVAARDQKVKRFVYAASSSTYGDHPGLPKVENQIGRPLSPYAVTKYVNELYADVFGRCYGLETIGLRYFNVFGPRQDPHGSYSAVIPRWIGELMDGKTPTIFGDGETSRDFCYVENVVQANVLAATTENHTAINEVFNVAVGDRTTLRQLCYLIRELLDHLDSTIHLREPRIGPSRQGDVRHSQADISKARELLGYFPSHSVRRGMEETVHWFANQQAMLLLSDIVAEGCKQPSRA